MDTLFPHSHDRVGFTACVALAIHATLILGINFSQQDRKTAPPSLEVTLAQHSSDKAPVEADFIAQENQQGSGTQAEKALLTSPYESQFHDTKINYVDINQLASAAAAQEQAIISSLQQSELSQKTATETPAGDQSAQSAELRLSQQIASVSAKLEARKQTLAKQPKVRRLTSVSSKKSVDALYLNNWRNKVEAIGNKNYPELARRQRMFGNLRMMVAIRPDGSIKEVKLLQSSGHKILDEAAMRIVHLAGPYEPFPPELRAEADILEIIRTWQFKQNRLSSSG